MRDVVLDPQEMLALYSSEAQLDRGHTVMLNSIKCQNQNIFLIVETTCPLHRVQQPPLGDQRSREQVLDMKDEEDDYENTVTSKDTEDMDKSAVPDWLEAELKEAETDDKSNKRKQKKRKKKKSHHEHHADHPHSVVDDDERVKRLEKEYERRQQEIMLEAEAAVKAREEALNQELSRLREELEKQRGLQSDYIHDKMGRRKSEDEMHSSSGCCIQ